MTARHAGDEQPHYHVANPSDIAATAKDAKLHITGCVVCSAAAVMALHRAAELDALGPIEIVPEVRRDELYQQTRELYCADGLRLILLLGEAALGSPVFSSA